jgi:type I restriction enzyme S subunit
MSAIVKKSELEKLKRYKPYPAYKDSGVEWLGEVPEHWDLKRLKYTIIACQNGVWGEEPVGGPEDVICVRVADFDRTRNKVVLHEPTLRSVPQHQQEDLTLNSGELLIEKSGGGEQQPVGAVVLYDLGAQAVCSNFIARIQIEDSYSVVFLLYLHKYLYESCVNKRSIKQNTGIQNLDLKSYLSEYVALPDIKEQNKVAKFLDRETSKIDSFIAKQERLIELLQEKRAALITRAVTKGLDPDVPMKDSGVEWLGEIPAHWEIYTLKRVALLKSGEMINSDFIEDDGEFPVYGGNGLRGYTTSYTHEGKHVLIGRQGALCGNINYAYGKFWASEHAIVVHPIKPVDTLWLGELLRTMNLNQYSISAAQPGLAVEKICNIYIPVPPLAEQTAISDYLKIKITYINRLYKKTSILINRIKEYRTALISAAVTGKIDVRGEVS